MDRVLARGNLLIDARCDNRGSTIHKRFDFDVCRGQQEFFDRHNAEEPVSLTHDNVARAFITPSNQEFSDVADPLEAPGHRNARGGMFGGGFEAHVGLAPGPLPTAASISQCSLQLSHSEPYP